MASSEQLAELTQTMAPRVATMAARWCGSEAPDGAQEVQRELVRAWPDFRGDSAPTTWAHRIAVRGVVGAWSEPVDGMRARMLASRKATSGKPLAIAVQLRNDSDRARSFNIIGTTIAAIPQPFHFDLVVDGVQWQQRKGLDVVTGSDWMMLPQPVGTTRSIVVLADYWQDPEEVGTTLSGQHDLGIRFHFMPSVWKKELWMGQIDTPSIAIEFPDKR